MTEHRISPLEWLGTKFASINHTHTGYLTSHQDITGKEDSSNKSSSISTDTGSTTKYPTIKAVEDYAQPKGSYLTSHQDISGKLDKAQTSYKGKNVVVDDSTGNITFENKPTIPTKVSDLTNDSNFITSSSVPSASSTTPSADTTNGSVGSGTTWAKADHAHPQSTIYASSDHNHNNAYISKASTDTGFVKSNGDIVGFGTTSTTVAQGNHTHSSYVNPTICDNLTTNDSTQVLSAKQGKVLNDLIGQAITYINQ